MYLTRVKLTDFRNHHHTALHFGSGLNFVVGANAQGKTNLLEAVYLACVGRGWRTARDRDLIRFGADTALVEVRAEKKFGAVDLAIKLSQTEKKAISLNQIPLAKVAELMGQINCVFFSPDELKMVKEAPADRRRFLDIDLSQLDKVYFYALLRYHKILRQRNASLKTAPHPRELAVWDQQLVEVGSLIIRKRQAFLRRLTPHIIAKHHQLTGGKEQITVTYETETDLATALATALEHDLRLRTTTVGPHRDDLKITVDGQDVRNFGSQGQQRTVALSIKLAELELFTELTGETPVLLLDDVLSELDSTRQQRLLGAIGATQTIITATAVPPGLEKDSTIFSVVNGQVSPLAPECAPVL